MRLESLIEFGIWPSDPGEVLGFKLLITSFISYSVIRLSIGVYSYNSAAVVMSARYCSKDDADNLEVQFQRYLKCSATSCFISAGSRFVVESSFRSALIIDFSVGDA